MRRCISWILVLLLLPAMIVPAYATENEGYSNYVDLMAQGFVTVDGVDDTDFRFTGSASNIVEFPVDVIGGMGEVEFVIYSPDSNISITSQNGISFSKYAMGDDDLYFFYADVQKSSIERFTFNCPGGKQVYIVSARARMTGDLMYDLTYDLTWRLGSYHTIDQTDVTSTTISLKVSDYFDTSSYTTYVSGRIELDTLDCKGLDYIDAHLFTCGMSATSISVITANNIYLPTEVSFTQSADPAVERDRYQIHIDISDKQISDRVYIYFYGVTTSSSSSFRWEVPHVVGGITQPEVSGEVGLLGRIWFVLRDHIPFLDSIDSHLYTIDTLFQSLVKGDKVDENLMNQDIEDAQQEATEQLEIIDSVTKPAPEELDDIADISDYVDSGGVGILSATLSPLFESDVFKPIIMLSLTFMLISYVLFGKR